MKRVIKSIAIILIGLLLLSPFSFATDNVDLKEQIKKEERIIV